MVNAAPRTHGTIYLAMSKGSRIRVSHGAATGALFFMQEIVQTVALQMSRFLSALGGVQDRVEAIEHRLAEKDDEINELKRSILVMQPRYHTLLHTFQSVQEAEMAWALLMMINHPDKYPTHELVPPMPMGRAFVAPWDPEPQTTPTPTKSIPLERKYQDEI